MSRRQILLWVTVLLCLLAFSTAALANSMVSGDMADGCPAGPRPSMFAPGHR